MKTLAELLIMTADELAAYYRTFAPQANQLDALFGREVVTEQLLTIESLYADAIGTSYPAAYQQLAA